MNQQRATITNDLIHQANELYRNDSGNALAIKRLRNEADKLKQVNAELAYVVLGMLSYLDGNIDEMHNNHQKAIRLSSSRITNLNYAVSLRKSGYLVECQKYFLAAYELCKDEEILNSLIVSFIETGQFSKASECAKKWKTTELEKIHSLENLLESFEGHVRKNKILESDIEKLIQIGLSILHEKNIFIMESEMSIEADDESKWISYMILVNKPSFDLINFNVELAERMAMEDLHPALTDNFILGYDFKEI